jgi:hypothetical protein
MIGRRRQFSAAAKGVFSLCRLNSHSDHQHLLCKDGTPAGPRRQPERSAYASPLPLSLERRYVMSLQHQFARGLAIIALMTAANSLVTSARADSEDISNTYQTRVASPAVQAAAAVNATKTDAATPALSGGHKGNEIYDKIFQPGNPETLLNTK